MPWNLDPAHTSVEFSVQNVEGEVTIHGVTRPPALEVETQGPVKDPWGNERLAAHFEGRLNRKDFGLTWNMALEAGGLLVGDEVRFVVDAELVKAAVPAS
jgi:polyisoprenoid-binding protein YceI